MQLSSLSPLHSFPPSHLITTMANTNRKRPPPAAAPTTTTLSTGIDQLLAKYARHLPPGSSVSVRLIKGPSSSSVDPIAARRNAVNAVPLEFPRVAKFTESVTRPDFAGSLAEGRMYEEDVPKAKVCFYVYVCVDVCRCAS